MAQAKSIFSQLSNSLPSSLVFSGGWWNAIDPQISAAWDFSGNRYMQNGVPLTQDQAITCVRSTTGTAQTSTGEIVEFGINEPRITDLGLLSEEQRTNLITYSQSYSNAAWTKTNVTVIDNDIVAPDGTLTGSRLIKSASAFATAYRVFTTSIGDHSQFFIVKAGSLTDATILLTGNNASTYARINVNLSTNIVSNTSSGLTLLRSGCLSLTDGWKLVYLSVNLPAVTNCKSYIYPGIQSSSTAGYIYGWGSQVEAGSFHTSYIPTTSTTATRAADVVTGNNFADWYNQPEGTFYYTSSTSQIAANKFIYSTNNNNAGSSLEEIGSYVGGGANINNLVTDGNVAQANLANGGAAITAGDTVYGAFSYKVNDFKGAYNGETLTPDTSGTIPTPDRIHFGIRMSYFSYNDYIKSVYYKPLSSTQAQLNSLSLSVLLTLFTLLTSSDNAYLVNELGNYLVL